jgi:hypothetical protein
MLTAAVYGSGCAASPEGEALTNKRAPVKNIPYNILKMLVYKYPESDNPTKVVKVPIYRGLEKSHEPTRIDWDIKRHPLEKGDHVPGNLADVKYVGTVDQAALTPEEAFECLRKLDSDLAGRVNASTEQMGFFWFSICVEDEESEDNLYKFCCYIQKGRKLFCSYSSFSK